MAAETEPAGGELEENGSLESRDPYSLSESGSKVKEKDGSGLPEGKPEPVAEPSAALLLGSGALWLIRRRP